MIHTGYMHVIPTQGEIPWVGMTFKIINVCHPGGTYYKILYISCIYQFQNDVARVYHPIKKG